MALTKHVSPSYSFFEKLTTYLPFEWESEAVPAAIVMDTPDLRPLELLTAAPFGSICFPALIPGWLLQILPEAMNSGSPLKRYRVQFSFNEMPMIFMLQMMSSMFYCLHLSMHLYSSS